MNWLNAIVEEEFNETYFSNLLESCLVNSYFLHSSINFESADVCSLFDESQIMKVNGWEPCFEELLERETKPLPFSVEALKYAFLAYLSCCDYFLINSEA